MDNFTLQYMYLKEKNYERLNENGHEYSINIA